jgi:hypothetical protein
MLHATVRSFASLPGLRGTNPLPDNSKRNFHSGLDGHAPDGYHPTFGHQVTQSTGAQAIQLQILRGMSGEQRLLLALEMSLFARELRARIRQEHPEWTEAQVVRELLRLSFLPAEMPPGL